MPRAFGLFLVADKNDNALIEVKYYLKKTFPLIFKQYRGLINRRFKVSTTCGRANPNTKLQTPLLFVN